MGWEHWIPASETAVAQEFARFYAHMRDVWGLVDNKSARLRDLALLAAEGQGRLALPPDQWRAMDSPADVTAQGRDWLARR